jgi:hypothetical protein
MVGSQLGASAVEERMGIFHKCEFMLAWWFGVEVGIIGWRYRIRAKYPRSAGGGHVASSRRVGGDDSPVL